MDIISKKIADITPYENNPRHNQDAIEPVAASIREFGFKVPIIIDSDGVIVAGHTRLEAAKLLDMEEVPCIVADDLTPDQIKAFRIVDNKVGELASWNYELLELEMADIDLDMGEFGFDFTEIDEPDLNDLETDDEHEDKFIVKVTFDTYNDWLEQEDDFRRLVDGSNASMVVGSV